MTITDMILQTHSTATQTLLSQEEIQNLMLDKVHSYVVESDGVVFRITKDQIQIIKG